MKRINLLKFVVCSSIIFSAVGYDLQTFTVKGKTNFDIVLATSKTTLWNHWKRSDAQSRVGSSYTSCSD